MSYLCVGKSSFQEFKAVFPFQYFEQNSEKTDAGRCMHFVVAHQYHSPLKQFERYSRQPHLVRQKIDRSNRSGNSKANRSDYDHGSLRWNTNCFWTHNEGLERLMATASANSRKRGLSLCKTIEKAEFRSTAWPVASKWRPIDDVGGLWLPMSTEVPFRRSSTHLGTCSLILEIKRRSVLPM